METYFREVRYYAYENIIKNILDFRAIQSFWLNHNLKSEVVSFLPESELDVTKILQKIIPNPIYL